MAISDALPLEDTGHPFRLSISARITGRFSGPTYQISAKSSNSRRNNCDSSMRNISVTSAISDLMGSEFSQFLRLGDPQCNGVLNFNTTEQYAAELSKIRQMFPSVFLIKKLSTLLRGEEWTKLGLHQICGAQRPLIGAPKTVLDFRWISSFRNQSASNAIVVKNQGQILDLPLVKFMEGVGETLASMYSEVQPRTKPLIHFCRDATPCESLAGRLNV